MAKHCVENESASIVTKLLLGYCNNSFNVFYFSLNWGFLISNAPLKYNYFDFLGSFHFCSYRLYKSLQHIIFQKTT